MLDWMSKKRWMQILPPISPIYTHTIHFYPASVHTSVNINITSIPKTLKISFINSNFPTNGSSNGLKTVKNAIWRKVIIKRIESYPGAKEYIYIDIRPKKRRRRIKVKG